MKKLQNDDFSKKIHDFLDEATKGFSPDLIEYLKLRFQNSMMNWITKDGADLQVKLVVDSNTVIRSLRYYAKTGKPSLLFKLKSNPLFPLYSPIDLETEVLEYIEIKEKNQKYKPKMKKAWNLIKQNITFQKEIHMESWNKAKEIIGKRDSDDIPFVGVYFDLNASGVITEDKDYEHPEIRQFNIESLGEIVGTFHRGIFSFFILNDISPLLFDFIKQISLSILKFLSEILVLFLGVFKALATGAISKIFELLSKAPSWLLWLFLGAFGVGIIAVLFHDSARNKVKSFAQSTKEKIKPIVDRIIHFMRIFFGKLIEYTKKSAPYASMTLISIKELSENIDKLQEEVQTLLSEESLFSS